jgi:hypothetical protein
MWDNNRERFWDVAPNSTGIAGEFEGADTVNQRIARAIITEAQCSGSPEVIQMARQHAVVLTELDVRQEMRARTLERIFAGVERLAA